MKALIQQPSLALFPSDMAGKTVIPKRGKDMNKEFLQYLQKCPPQQLQLWTWIYSISDQTDSLEVNLMDLRLQFKLTPKVFNKVLGLDEMQGQQFIRYRVVDNRTIKIEFTKKRNLQNAENQNIEVSEGNDKMLIINSEKQINDNGNTQINDNQSITISVGNGNEVIIKEQKDEIGIRKIEFSTQLKDMLIDDYTEFFVSHQKFRNSMLGMPSAPVLPPKIDGADIKFFKKLVAYFRGLPRPSGTTEPLTDEQTRACFRKIYTVWESLDSFLQNGIKPQQIYFNLNNIITQLNVSQINKNHRRNATFDQKTNEAGQRDFTRLLKNGNQAG